MVRSITSQPTSFSRLCACEGEISWSTRIEVGASSRRLLVQLLALADAEVRRRVEPGALLRERADHLEAQRLRELAQLGERRLELDVAHAGQLHGRHEGALGHARAAQEKSWLNTSSRISRRDSTRSCSPPGKASTAASRPSVRAPARDVAPVEHDVRFVRMHRQHRAVDVEAGVHFRLRGEDRPHPAEVGREIRSAASASGRIPIRRRIRGAGCARRRDDSAFGSLRKGTPGRPARRGVAVRA